MQPAAQQGLGAYGVGLGTLQGMATNPAQFNTAALNANMNPYIQNVIGASNQAFDLARQQGGAQVGLGAGSAFGRSSGQNVAQGTMLGQLGQAQAQQTAGLMSQGYGNAYNQWLKQQQMRAQNAAQSAGLGMQGAMMPSQMLAQGAGSLLPYAGRTGTTTGTGTTTMTQQNDPWGQLLGLGLTGAGMLFGGPAGAAVGGAMGSSILKDPKGTAIPVAPKPNHPSGGFTP
jgi:hypothetical protein